MSKSEQADVVLLALRYAAQQHRDQRRKDVDATPYINHPIDVASILRNEAGIEDDEVLAAALLHDTVEDTSTTLDDLQQRFGAHISSLVAELSDDVSLSSQERKRQQVEKAASASQQAKLVKIADKIANLRDIAASPPAKWTLQRQQAYFDWAAQVVAQLSGTHTVLEELFAQVLAQKP